MRLPEPDFCAVDGGALAFSRFGGGPKKAIYFHGHPGSRLQAAFLDGPARALGLEVVAFDRPGFGHSDPFRASPSNPLDLSQALLCLARKLRWKRFHLLAVSGGAPYALGSSGGLGNRVQSINLVCGLGPLHEARFRRQFPWAPLQAMRLGAKLPAPLAALALGAALRALRTRRGPSTRRPRFLSPGDHKLLHAPRVRPLLQASLEAAFRQGPGGAQRDLGAFFTPWELDYAAIECPVTFWHGREDRLVPWEFSEWLSERIPNSRLMLLEGEGHYTLPLNRTREILSQLLL